jgi:hypothetical protein
VIAVPLAGGGFLYLATVPDVGSRRLAGRSIADHLRTGPVADASRAAEATRGGLAGAILIPIMGRDTVPPSSPPCASGWACVDRWTLREPAPSVVCPSTSAVYGAGVADDQERATFADVEPHLAQAREGRLMLSGRLAPFGHRVPAGERQQAAYHRRGRHHPDRIRAAVIHVEAGADQRAQAAHIDLKGAVAASRPTSR